MSDPITDPGMSPLPSGPAPRPPAPPRRFPWRVALIALVALAIAGGVTLAYRHAGRLSSMFSTLQGKTQQLERANRELQQRLAALQTVQDEYAKLQAAYQSLSADRDNLLAQTKLSREEADRSKGERGVMERVLKQSFRKESELKGQLALLTESRRQLQAEHEQVVEERDRLQRRFAQAQQQMAKAQVPARAQREQQLRKTLTKETHERKKALTDLRKAQKRIDEAQARSRKAEAQAASLAGELASLQERYATIFGENTALKRKAKTVPPQVTKLAQQHQRLLKDAADMHYNMGVLFSNEKQYLRAAAEFQKVVELRPDDAEAHYNLGVLYSEHLADREKSLNYFRRYLQISPGAKDAGWVKEYIASWQAWEAKDRLE